LGTALVQENKLPEATEAFKKAIEANPKKIELYSKLALIQVNEKKLDEASATFQKAIEVDPKMQKFIIT
jgi:superkiller protein 3